MATQTAQIRLIAGKWRSRRLRFPRIEGLRASPDAVRETLFNWLQADIRATRCLDLFAGSGALGLEAASRGAATVDLVECQPQALHALRKNIHTLQAAEQVTVHAMPADTFLEQCHQRRGDKPRADSSDASGYDLVFLDPPYASDHLAKVCHKLAQYALLNPAARIYIEAPQHAQPLPLASTWHIIRQQHCGQVLASLVATD